MGIAWGIISAVAPITALVAATLFAAAPGAPAAPETCTPVAVKYAQANIAAAPFERVPSNGDDLTKAKSLLSARRYGDAEKSLLLLVRTARTSRERVEALQLLGVARLMVGDARLAKRAFEEAIGAAGPAGVPEIASQARYNLGLLALGFAEAGETTERSLSLFGRSPWDAALRHFEDAVPNAEPSLLQKVHLGAARAVLAGRKVAEARQRFNILSGKAGSDMNRLAVADLGRRIAAMTEDESANAQISAKVAALLEPIRRARDLRVQSYAEGILASVALDLGDRAKALKLAQKALWFAELAAAEDLKLRWLALTGQIHLAVGTPESRAAALVAFVSARQSVERVRANLPQFDPVSGRSLFREIVDPIYVSLAELLIDQGQTSETQTIGGRTGFLHEARNTIEVLKQVEAEQFFQDECVAAALGRRVSLEKVLEREPTTAVVYPVLISRKNKDRLIVLVSRTDAATKRETIRKIEVPVAPGELQSAARAFREVLSSDSRAIGPIRRHGATLYDRLIRPIESELSGIDTIVFLPDGVLRSVPWAALYDTKTERYLVDRFATANSISIELTAPKAIADVARRVLVAGVSSAVRDEETGGILGVALPNVERELTFLSGQFGGASESLGDNLNRRALSGALARDNFTIVHLAMHAKFGGAPRENYVLGSDGPITFDELAGYIRTTQLNGRPIELLALSACETAQGDDRAALGLAGVAVSAGARSVVGSLWRISDDATPLFFESFYRALDDPSQSKAKAVQAAQIALLRGKRAKYTNPAFWAPFVLIGNWQ